MRRHQESGCLPLRAVHTYRHDATCLGKYNIGEQHACMCRLLDFCVVNKAGESSRWSHTACDRQSCSSQVRVLLRRGTAL